ncbi:hypothetical protein [Spirosoma endbachense]|uniref:Uncharacterized protein n=1 Tax=Spirosoma endbachense TaxID=2666025 RepID=A0A6P1VVS9_9BACT|nr:hypothetical protein [Spirosoma endbachense]QHV96855.1 hypothetical protein GJR95_18385 [Spirosoma endbachense]
MDDAKAYVTASRYETFMCRALNCGSDPSDEAHLSVMKDLILLEEGKPRLNRGSVEEHFKYVKKLIGKGLAYSMRYSLPSHDKDVLTKLQGQLDMASNSGELMAVIDSAIEATDLLQ